jgi:hypothetical protein
MSNWLKSKLIKLLLAWLLIIAIVPCFSCITFVAPGSSSSSSGSQVSSNYVILTNITAAQDPYYAALLELQKLRNGRIVRFEQTAREALPELLSLRPRYIAVLVKPEVIDLFFASDIFSLTREIRNKTGVDLAYGFVTGDTAQNLLNYIQRLKSWEADGKTKKPVFRAYFSSGEGALGGSAGGWGEKQTKGELEVFTKLGINSKRIDVAQVDDAAVVSDLQQYQRLYLHFLLHGSPTKLEGLQVARIMSLTFPSIIFNSGCYGGSLSKWYDESAPVLKPNQAVKVEVSQTLAMRFQNSGCIAYFGHMRMLGSNLWVTDMTNVLVNFPAATAGDLALAWYKKADQPQSDKTENPGGQSTGQDMSNYFSVILIGDPAVRIIPDKGN